MRCGVHLHVDVRDPVGWGHDDVDGSLGDQASRIPGMGVQLMDVIPVPMLMVWCGAVQCGVVQGGAGRCGAGCAGPGQGGTCGSAWCGMAWQGVAWHGGALCAGAERGVWWVHVAWDVWRHVALQRRVLWRGSNGV